MSIDPSRWPQNPLALTASINCTKKMAQFSPLASSFGTVAERVSDSEEVVRVVISVVV